MFEISASDAQNLRQSAADHISDRLVEMLSEEELVGDWDTTLRRDENGRSVVELVALDPAAKTRDEGIRVLRITVEDLIR